MVFSSAVFLCLFLPLTLGIYLVLPAKLRNAFLFAASLAFYAWGEPIYLLLMLFSTGFNYVCGLLLERWKGRGKASHALLVGSVAVNVGLLVFFKYTDFLLGIVNDLTGAAIPLLRLALPIGISFYTFQAMTYTVDVYRGSVRAQHNVLDFGMYISLFPQLIAGPIVRYSEIEPQLRGRRLSADRMTAGMLRFTAGLCKKVLLANQIGALWDEISASAGTAPALTAWLGALAFTFQIYFDFSGYSDMAIGLGKLLGFDFPENFRYPYTARSVTDFWRRWHITLSAWFRNYVYIPLGGSRRGLARQIRNLLIVWLLTGLWHGAGVNFLLWGLYYFAFLALEKLFVGKLLARIPRVFGCVYTLLIVMFGWVIFACDSPAMLADYVPSLLGANGFADPTSLYHLRTAAPLLLVCAVVSSGLPLRLWKRWRGRLSESLGTGLEMAASLPALLLCFVFLIGGSYNPFLYFRF